MSSASYFIRSRGKISGPFDVAALQKLIRRGMLSRMHELSSDRVAWTSAGEFDELFPGPATAVIASDAPANVTPRGSQIPAPAAGSPMYSYVQNGASIGPVPASVLQSLASNGSLGPDDLVWAEGTPTAVPAAQVTILAPIFSRTSRANSSIAMGEPLSDREREGYGIAAANIAWLALVAGVVIGFLILLSLNLPAGSDRDGKTRWWWDVLKQPQSGTSTVLLFYLLAAGLMVMVMGVTTEGFLRAWVSISISGLSFLLFLILGLMSAKADGGYFFILIVPYLIAALLGISYLRAHAAKQRVVALFQGIIGGTLVFFTVITGIVWLTQQPLTGVRPLLDTNELPGWLVVSLVIAALGSVGAMISGILGLVSLKQRFSRSMNWALVVISASSILLPAIGFVIALCGFVSVLKVERSGLVIFLFVRGVVIFLALVALMSVGMLEVFSTACLRPFAIAKHASQEKPIDK